MDLLATDQTAWSAKHRIQNHFPKDAERYLKGHYQLIKYVVEQQHLISEREKRRRKHNDIY